MHGITFFVIAILLIVTIAQTVSAEEIPNWIKSKIKLWTLDKIDDQGFVDSIIQLDKRGLIKLQNIQTSSVTYKLPKYGETTFVTVSGRVSNIGQTSPVTLIITRPDGLRMQYTIPILQSGAYSTSIPIEHDYPAGTYEVTGYHAGRELSPYNFDIQKDILIPAWIKTATKWWADGKVSDEEFLDGIQYLVDQKILSIKEENAKTDSSLDVTVHGQKAVRRGTVQNLDIHVDNSNGAVNGVTVFVRVEDYGENILKEFRGETNSDGNYSVSYELSKDYADIKTFLVYVDVTDGISSKTKVFSFQAYCLCGEPNCKCRN